MLDGPALMCPHVGARRAVVRRRAPSVRR